MGIDDCVPKVSLMIENCANQVSKSHLWKHEFRVWSKVLHSTGTYHWTLTVERGCELMIVHRIVVISGCDCRGQPQFS